MAKVYEFLADGFEEVEALGVVDVLRRGGVEINTVSVMETEEVVSSHGIKVKADLKFDDIDNFDDADMLLIPGGVKGAENLEAHNGVREALKQQAESNKFVGAICAGPMVLGSIGLLKGKQATCYPGFEKYMDGATYTRELVSVDGKVVTGEGPAATFPYAYKILELFVGPEKTQEIKKGMRFTHLMGEE